MLASTVQFSRYGRVRSRSAGAFPHLRVVQPEGWSAARRGLQPRRAL